MDDQAEQVRAQQVDVGRKLRHWRRVKGLTLMELADRVGCSESLLSKIENDKVRPSIRILHRLVAALEANVSQLFKEDSPEGDVVVRPAERLRISAQGDLQGDGITLENLMPGAGSALMQATLHVVEPGGATDGTIEHAGEEVGYVVEGCLELLVGERTFTLKAGDSFHFRSDQPHGYRNSGTSVARVLWVNTPPTF